MEFDYLDETDERIVACAPRTLSYPSRVADAPASPGVYVFLDDANEVIYVGSTGHAKLAREIKSKWNTGTDLGALRYRWFRTDSDDAANQIEAEWLRKYQPRNNVGCRLPIGTGDADRRLAPALIL
jgi:excinuclease UvrABC nuclease subunit